MKKTAALFYLVSTVLSSSAIASTKISEIDAWMSPLLKVHQLRGSPGCENLTIYGVAPTSMVPGGMSVTSQGHYGVILKGENDEIIKHHILLSRDETDSVNQLTHYKMDLASRSKSSLGISKKSRTNVIINRNEHGELQSIELSYKEEPFYLIDYGFRCYR